MTRHHHHPDEVAEDSDDVSNPYQIGDPVMDAAQGRPMVVLDAPATTVAAWSDANGYDLLGNYANSKFDPEPDEAVVECVYVSDVRSEPSKTYTFPVSRVALIDAHHADDGRRLAERVLLDVFEQMFARARAADDADTSPDSWEDAVATCIPDEFHSLQLRAVEKAKFDAVGNDE